MARSRTKALKELLAGIASEWRRDNVPRQAAAVAYYTVFSLPSFLVVLIAAASALLGRGAVEEGLFRQLGTAMGPDTAETLRGTIAGVRTVRAGAFGTVLGIAALLLGAIAVFRELQTSLNQILKTEDAVPKAAGILGAVRSYLLSFSLLLTSAFLLLVSMGLSVVLGAVTEEAAALLPAPVNMLALSEFLLSALVITLLFFLLYRFLPSERFGWKPILAGSVAATSLFLIGKGVLGYSVARASGGSPYGLAASLLVLLTWIYYSSMIFLTGAELIDQFHRKKVFR